MVETNLEINYYTSLFLLLTALLLELLIAHQLAFWKFASQSHVAPPTDLVKICIKEGLQSSTMLSLFQLVLPKWPHPLSPILFQAASTNIYTNRVFEAEASRLLPVPSNRCP